MFIQKQNENKELLLDRIERKINKWAHARKKYEFGEEKMKNREKEEFSRKQQKTTHPNPHTYIFSSILL